LSKAKCLLQVLDACVFAVSLICGGELLVAKSAKSTVIGRVIVHLTSLEGLKPPGCSKLTMRPEVDVRGVFSHAKNA
jgi:hypothetical protein